MATAFQQSAFQDSAFQIDAAAGLHGRPIRPPWRRRGKVGELDRQWRDALEAAASLREQLECPVRPSEEAALRDEASELAEVLSDIGLKAAAGMARSMMNLIMRAADEKRARDRAAKLAAKIEQELQDEEEFLLLIM